MTDSAMADKLLKRAEKAARPGLFARLSGDTDMTEAVDLFRRAACFYQMAKEPSKAAAAFVRAAELCDVQPAEFYASAANAYIAAHQINDAVGMFKKAGQLAKNAGKLSRAAAYLSQLAELHEKQANYADSIEPYIESAQLMELDGSSATAMKKYVCAAHNMARVGEYEKAARLFEQAGNSAVDDQLRKFSAKEYFFKASLCWLCCGDDASVRISLYADTSAIFRNSREHEMIDKLASAMTSNDTDAFVKAIAEHDQITPLDSWLTSIALAAKRRMNAPDELC